MPTLFPGIVLIAQPTKRLAQFSKIGRAAVLNVQHSDELHQRRISENEQLVFGWRYLIEKMRAEGRDVTVACDLLKAFEDDLERRRSHS